MNILSFPCSLCSGHNGFAATSILHVLAVPSVRILTYINIYHVSTVFSESGLELNLRTCFSFIFYKMTVRVNGGIFSLMLLLGKKIFAIFSFREGNGKCYCLRTTETLPKNKV